MQKALIINDCRDLDQINKYLADGWVVISSNPMGGVSLVIIEKEMTQDEIEQYKKK